MVRSKSSKIILGLIIIIVLCGGVAVAVATFNKDDSKDSNTSKAENKAPKTNNPKEVIAKLPDYTGKEVTLDGIISKVNNDYYLANLDKKNPGAIKLDFSKTKLDPTQYLVSPAGDTSSTPPPKNDQKVEAKVVQATVSVTGTVSQKDANSQPVLIVKSIEKN